MMQHVRLEIRGLVQGVGFRPFVYNLAKKYHLHGTVFNTGDGVIIEVEGSSEEMQLFNAELRTKPPMLARIDHIEIHEQEVKHFEGFEILESRHHVKTTSISPDIAVCDTCLSEMKDPHNRRYGYYLTNCTDCGPRYSIIETLPYDRDLTSMKPFKMCNDCQEEYDDPTNRRYHAQPISCHACGPVLSMMDRELNLITQGNSVIEKTAKYLKDGAIVALKGIGGFHLICDATNEQAVSILRIRKNRPKKPFAVMFSGMNQLSEYLCVDEKESKWLTSKESPIVLVKKRSDSATLAWNIAPDIDTIGAMLAYAPIHHLLFDCFTSPLVATSANRSDEPIVRDVRELRDRLGSVVDVIVDFNRDIVNTVDDSILQVIQNRSSILRLGRGYAPLTFIHTAYTPFKILAVGGQQKNTIGLAFEDKMILSPHIGDLYSLEGMEYFERTVETFKRFYDFSPDVIVCDKHPEYATAQWATNQSVRIIAIQHHYAHALSCMAEFGLESQVLAFCFDGTGYGDDGNIWGGEIFIADPIHCERIGHLKAFRLLGGEKAIKEPKRVALALLFEIYSLEEIQELDLPVLRHFSPDEIKSYYKIWIKGINSPLCTSMGRVFDAMASFCDIIHEECYEGETGRRLEELYDPEIKEQFDYAIENGIIDLSPMIRSFIRHLHAGQYAIVATGFINTIAAIMEDFAGVYPNFPIVLSGGVFQNKTLLALAVHRLEEKGQKVYFQEQTPINDGGIALGQLYYAHHHIRSENGG